jgi:phosphoserine phosphatase
VLGPPALTKPHRHEDAWQAFVDNLHRPTKPKRQRPVRLVCFDLDGVLIEAKSSWVAVHEAFGVRNEESLRLFLHGEISEEEFIRRDVALWLTKKPDVTLDDIDRILEGVVLHPGARDLIDALHARGIKTAVVSGGIALAAHRVAAQLGIQLVSAQELLAGPGGRLSGEGIVNTPLRDKSVPVRRFAKDLRIPLGHVASVGNSAPDVPMFWASGLGIAFDPMDEHTSAEADVTVRGPDLRALLPVLLDDAD